MFIYLNTNYLQVNAIFEVALFIPLPSHNIMNKSNIFVHIELSKLVAGLRSETILLKQSLKSQAGYFNIIPLKYFSDVLCPEWENIIEEIKHKGPKLGFDGKILVNAVTNTIDQMSVQECAALALRIMNLNEKVKLEFE